MFYDRWIVCRALYGFSLNTLFRKTYGLLVGSDSWKYWAELRAGNIDEKDWEEIEDGIARAPGTCMTMGTAATMMSSADALGLTLPGVSSIPAADSNHSRMATRSGRRIVEMVWDDLKPGDILTEKAFENDQIRFRVPIRPILTNIHSDR